MDRWQMRTTGVQRRGSCFPQASKSVQIITYENDSSISLNEESLREAFTTYRHKEVKVISVSGPLRSGKSTLLNVWAKKTGAFVIDHTTKPVTKGVWMDVIEYKGQVLVLLDTEGWHDATSEKQDVWLPLIMLFVSSELIFNIKNEINDIYIRNISSLLCLSMNSAKHVRPSGWKVPLVRTLIRDFDLDHEEEDTADDYLEKQIAGSHINQRILRENMKNRRCHTLPRPHAKPKTLGTQQNGKVVRPEQEFMSEAFALLDEIAIGQQFSKYSDVYMERYSSFTHMNQKRSRVPFEDWCQQIVHVTREIEKLRKSDPEGICFNMDIKQQNIVENAKEDFTQKLGTWDIVSDSPSQPFERAKLNSCCDKHLDAVKGNFPGAEAALSEFASSTLQTVEDDIFPKLEKGYNLLSELEGVEDLLNRFSGLTETSMFFPKMMEKFCMLQLRTLLIHITIHNEWMEEQISMHVQKLTKKMEQQNSESMYKMGRKTIHEEELKALRNFEDKMKEPEFLKENDQLCNDLCNQHVTWWEHRYKTLDALLQVATALNKAKLGTNVTKTVSGGLGIAAGVLAIVSIPVPVVLPAALAVGGAAIGTSVASTSASFIIGKKNKNTLKNTMDEDNRESKSFRESVQKLEEAMAKYEKQSRDAGTSGISADCNHARFQMLGGGAAATSLLGNLGKGALNVADIATDPLVAIGRIGGGVLAGVGIAVDVAFLSHTIHDMVKNKNKHEISKYIDECIDKLELEMELYTRIVIPVKYYLLKARLERKMQE